MVFDATNFNKTEQLTVGKQRLLALANETALLDPRTYNQTQFEELVRVEKPGPHSLIDRLLGRTYELAKCGCAGYHAGIFDNLREFEDLDWEEVGRYYDISPRDAKRLFGSKDAHNSLTGRFGHVTPTVWAETARYLVYGEHNDGL